MKLLLGGKTRRKRPRIVAFNLVKANRVERTYGEQVGNITDLSEAGVQFRYTGTIRKGERVKLTLNLMQLGKDISVFGKVIWVKQTPTPSESKRCVVGATFSDIAREDSKAIRKYIRSLPKSKKKI